jgi:hypothetical protein
LKLNLVAGLRTLEFAEDFLNLLVTFLALEVNFNDQNRILLVNKAGETKVLEMLHYNAIAVCFIKRKIVNMEKSHNSPSLS